ncbi:MAG: hypothetical protein EXR71_05120 [Myxococcales bacterium]|nr:hypothetical protein [Myxococcales bacterium]
MVAMNRRPGPSAAPFSTRAHGRGSRPEVNPYRDEHQRFGKEIIAAEQAPSYQGRWLTEFGRDAPRHLELGVGNGSWLAASAARAPAGDWIGLEIRYKRCVQAAEKLRAAGATNARVARYSWFELERLFATGELAGIHINHPDPWSHPSDAKHRLITPGFLEGAGRVVAPGGELRLKTDFDGHHRALLAAVAASPTWTIIGASDDIGRAGAPWPDDIVTGYQAKFQRAGQPVYGAWIRRLPCG